MKEIAVLIILVAIALLIHTILSIMRFGRIEHTARMIAPFRWCEKRKRLIPLFVAVAPELGVRWVDFEWNKEGVMIHLQLTWWAQLNPFLRKRLQKKATKALEEGGITIVDWC